MDAIDGPGYEIRNKATALRRAVWNLTPELRSYGGIMAHFEERNCYFMELDVKNNEGKNYLYGFDHELRMLTVSDPEGNSWIGICPYNGCSIYSGNGWVCPHLINEMTSRELAVGASDQKVINKCGINAEGIRKIFEVIASRRGLPENTSSTKNLRAILDSVGRRPFVDQELGVLVRRLDARALSLHVTDLGVTTSTFTCASEACEEPTAYYVGLGCWMCPKHAMSRTLRAPMRKEIPMMRSQALNEICDLLNIHIEKLTAISSDDWLRFLEYLWKRGDSGYTIAFKEKSANFYLTKTMQFGYVWEAVGEDGKVSTNKRYMCIGRACFAFAQVTCYRDHEPGDYSGSLCSRCAKSPLLPFDSITSSFKHGCESGCSVLSFLQKQPIEGRSYSRRN